MRRLLALVALLVLVPAAPAEAQEVVPQQRAGVLVLGVGGLRWDDVGPQTPALLRLAGTGAVGALSVKARPAVSCAADGWLTLGAGTRADSLGPGASPCPDGLPVGPGLASRNADTPDGARIGALAEALDGQYYAEGPGALLALQGSGGQPAPVVVVDAGTLDDGDRAAGLRRIDAVVADAVRRRPAEVDLLVVGVSAAVGERRAHLHVAMAAGPSFPRGALRSASTRRAPYIQLIDVAPTVLAVLRRPVPEVMDGQPWQVVGPAPSVAELVDLDRKAQGQREATVPFFGGLLAVSLVLLVLLWRRPRAAELVGLTTVAALGASYLANLLPWWRVGVPLLGLLAVVVPVALALTTAALIFAEWWPTRRRRPPSDEDRREAGGAAGGSAGVAGAAGGSAGSLGCPGSAPSAGTALAAQVVCGLVAAVLVVDLLTGAHLQVSSVAGHSPLVAGRFAGIGNVGFGVLAAAVLLAASAARRVVVLAGVGVLAVVADGAPAFGSDVGGVLALVPAFVLLVLLRTGARVTAGRLAVAGAGAALVVTGFALADWSRDRADRTHLGRFVQDLVDGTAGPLLERKAAAVLDLVFLSPVTATLPFVAAAAAYLLLRPPTGLRRALQAAPDWRHGLLAVSLASLLGFLLNDSGAAVPALALGVAIPATAAVVARARRN